MKKIYVLLLLSLLVSCNKPVMNDFSTVSGKEMQLINKEYFTSPIDQESPKVQINLDSFKKPPEEWGENVTGVKQRFLTDKKEIALTFDLCGGPYGSGFDVDLVTYLQTEEIPATLFVNERWILENTEIFQELINNPLFQIENHGTAHSPLSVNGGEAWGIPATNSPEEVFEEIMENHQTVYELTGHRMTLFRSGTAFYDEEAVKLANVLGYEVVNFDVLGDAGATFSPFQVEQALLSASPGSIVLLHMNQPNSGTRDGVKAAVPQLRADGFRFVLLEGKELE